MNLIPFRSFVNEARRNPEQNKHVSAWDYIETYYEDKNVFITFTNIPKVGINPKSEHNTPNGIYTYPLKEYTYEYIQNDLFGSYTDSPNDAWENPYVKRELGMFKPGYFAPYAGDNAPYISFLEIRRGTRGIDLNTYSDRDYKKDLDKLEKYFNSTKPQREYPDYFMTLVNNGITDGELKKIWKTVYSSSREQHTEVKNIFKKYKVDPKKWEDMKPEIDKLSSNGFDEYVLINWKSRLLDVYTWDEFISKIDFRGKAGRKIWTLTYELSLYMSKRGDDDIGSRNSNAPEIWNLIFSKVLGYHYVLDRKGEGIIHPSEPMQAVFFNSKAINVIWTGDNKPKKIFKRRN